MTTGQADGRRAAGRVQVVRLRIDDRWCVVLAHAGDGIPLVVVEARKRWQPGAQAMLCAMVGYAGPVPDAPPAAPGVHTMPPLPAGFACQVVDAKGLAVRSAAVPRYAAALREGIAVLFGAQGTPLRLQAGAA